MGNLNDFYFRLLNIKNKTNNFVQIKSIVDNVINELSKSVDSFDRFCKVVSNHISYELTKQGIFNRIINTKDLYGIYEHEFIIASYYEGNNLNLVLIDPTFDQFVFNQNKILTENFIEWPSIILSQTESGQQILNSLIKDSMCIIDEQGINLYLKSLSNLENFNFNYQQIILNDSKQKN